MRFEQQVAARKWKDMFKHSNTPFKNRKLHLSNDLETSVSQPPQQQRIFYRYYRVVPFSLKVQKGIEGLIMYKQDPVWKLS